MKMLSVILFFLPALQVAAQEEVWFDGMIVTDESEVFCGKILYNPSYDLVVFRGKNAREVFTALKMRSFRYYDESANINRKFVSIQDTPARIFEVVVHGEVTVLRRARSGIRDVPSDEGGYNYFFVKDDRIIPLKKFRSSLYPLLRSTIPDEIAKARLNPNQSADAIRMISIYNAHQFSASLARK